MLRGKFIAICVYSKKEERSHTSTLTFHLKTLYKEEHINIKHAERGKYEKLEEKLMKSRVEKH